MFQDIVEASLLFDFYGRLLPKRQRQVMELYYEENLSLGEIGEEINISRQGVYDALKSAQKSLEQYEAKLGRKKDFEKRKRLIEESRSKIKKLEECQKALDEIGKETQNKEMTMEDLKEMGNSIEDIIFTLGEIEKSILEKIDKLA